MNSVDTRPDPRPTLALTLIAAVAALAVLVAPAHAQYENDTLHVSVGTSSSAGVELHVTAGPTGAPGGFSVWWMTKADFEAYGSQWWPGGAEFQLQSSFTGVPTLNTEGGTVTSYVLGPNQTAVVEIGDLFDETGLAANSVDELTPGTEYVFCAFANPGNGLAQSDYSTTYASVTLQQPSCIHSQGYWKTHASQWPVSGLTLGTVTYTNTQLLSILNTPAAGNGLLSLAHQYIATLLNLASGADPSTVTSAIAAAQALIGGLVIPPIGSGYLAPATTSSLTQVFDNFNTGVIGSGNCLVPTKATTWGRVKALYR